MAEYGASSLGTDGVSTPQVVGVPLNGQGPVATIADTDGGQLDGDPRWDHAVGPMQFIPSTWDVVGVDGDGDGTRSIDDIDDAALAAGIYLCAGSENLSADASVEAALHRYNDSDSYVALVMAYERKYEGGDFTVTSPDGGLVVTSAALVSQPLVGHSVERHDARRGSHPDSNQGRCQACRRGRRQDRRQDTGHLLGHRASSRRSSRGHDAERGERCTDRGRRLGCHHPRRTGWSVPFRVGHHDPGHLGPSVAERPRDGSLHPGRDHALEPERHAGHGQHGSVLLGSVYRLGHSDDLQPVDRVRVHGRHDVAAGTQHVRHRRHSVLRPDAEPDADADPDD